MSRLAIKDPTKIVRIRKLQQSPFEVNRLTCSCGSFTVDTGDAAYALELWGEHAEQSGHEGDFAVIVEEPN